MTTDVHGLLPRDLKAQQRDRELNQRRIEALNMFLASSGRSDKAYWRGKLDAYDEMEQQ
jgi:hypothetical protein